MNQGKIKKFVSALFFLSVCTLLFHGRAFATPKYENIDTFRNGIARFCVKTENGKKCGFINTKGEEVLPPIYDSIDYPDKYSEGMFWVRKGEYNGYVNLQGEEKVKIQYESVSGFTEGLCPVSKVDEYGKRFGFVNAEGKEVIKPKYDDVNSFSEGRAVVRKNLKYGLIDKKGRVILTPKYGWIDSFREGRAKVGRKGRYGYIDRNGKEIIRPIYTEATDFVKGIAGVSTGRGKKIKWFIIDKKGKILLRLNVDRVDLTDYRDEKWIRVWKRMGREYKVAFIDRKGREILKPKYDSVFGFTDGIAVACIGDENGDFGLIDENGKEILKPLYTHIGEFHDGLAVVHGLSKEKEYRDGYVNKKGKFVVDLKYWETSDFSEGFAAVQKPDRKWGYINKKGEEITEFKYNGAESFSEGLAAVFLREEDDEESGKYGFVNIKGEEVIAPQYDRVTSFSEGVSAVLKGDIWYLIDKTGAVLKAIEP